MTETSKAKRRQPARKDKAGAQPKCQTQPAGGMKPNNALTVEQTTEETGAQAMARKLLQPTLKNAAAASAFTGKMMGSDLELPGIGDYADHVHFAARDAAGGDLTMASKILAAQAITLDSMFAELARRAALNMGEYINAAETYGRLAVKAQGNCRATLEALAKLHQPREQTVRHVHVNEGGQAVIADQFHHHAGGTQMQNPPNNPMQPEPARLAAAPRCLAMTRKGTACQSPAIRGAKRCRMHGGKGSGAPEGNRNAWKHGGRSADAIAAARLLSAVAYFAKA